MFLAQGVAVSASSIHDSKLPQKSGAEVFRELHGRPLIRYLRREDVGRYLLGDHNRHCVTPTPYTVDDMVSFLNLPDPLSDRTHCLLLNPARIPAILGPRHVHWGGGIEYILPQGFEQKDLLFAWALEVK